jgi:undecaprenyl-diphosphatase
MIIDSLHRLDQYLTLFINSLHSVPSDMFWMFVSEKTTWYPLYLILLCFLFVRLGWKRALPVIVGAALVVLASDQVTVYFKDVVVRRLRPLYDTWMLQNGLHWLEARTKSMFGFFSGHSANSFAIVIYLVTCFRMDKNHTYKALAFWGYVWAALLAISRIMVGKHYFGDVLVGCATGLLIGWLIARLVCAMCERYIIQEK